LASAADHPPPSAAPGPGDLIAKLCAAGIHDERLLDAFRRVPRAVFMPDESRHRAYLDVPLPIAHGQVTTQSSLLAIMVQALALSSPSWSDQASSRVRWLRAGTPAG